NASRNKKERFEQRVTELFQLASRPDLYLTGAASRDLVEVSELDLERDGAPTNTRALAVLPHLVDDLLQSITGGFIVEEVSGKRVLGSHGFPYPIGTHRPFVNAASSPVVVGTRFPEMLLQVLQSLGFEVEPGLDSESIHLRGCRWPDAVKLPDRQGLDE